MKLQRFDGNRTEGKWTTIAVSGNFDLLLNFARKMLRPYEDFRIVFDRN